MERRTEDARGISQALAQAGFLAIALYLVHATASPFRIEEDWAEARVRLVDGLFAYAQDWPSQLLPYLAFGWVVAFRFGASRSTGIRSALFVLFLELLQLIWIGRHPRLMDLGVGWVGLGIGMQCARFVMHFRGGRALSVESAPRLAALGFAGMTLVVGLGMSSAYHGSSLSDWDDRFPLVVGAEPDGTGVYRGGLVDLVVWPQALSDAEVFALASTSVPEQSAHWREQRAAVGWTLCGLAGTPAPSFRSVVDPDGLPRLESRSSGVAIDSDGRLSLSGGSLATEPLGNLQRHCIASAAFTIALRCRPDDDHARGGRLVALTEGPRRRNLAWVRNDRDLELRVRCGATGWNAMRHPIRWQDVLKPDHWVHLTVRWDRGRVQLFRDGVPFGHEHWVLETRVRDRSGTGYARIPVVICWFTPLAAFAIALARARLSLRLAVLPPVASLAAIVFLVLPSAAQAGAEPPWITLSCGAVALGIAAFRSAHRVLEARNLR